MADLKGIYDEDGNEIIDSTGGIEYNAIMNIPSSLVDTSTHNHDDLYPSKELVEDEFTYIMNKVATITRSLSIRPLKTKGFLNGGYKSSSVWAQRVQRFNVVTETGIEIGQIGSVTSYYTPGGTTEKKGYYFGTKTSSTAQSDNPRTGREIDEIVYLTETESYLGNLMQHDARSTLYNVYTQDQIYVCDNGSSWSNLDPSTNTVTLLTTSQTAHGFGRQALSSEFFGYVIEIGSADRTSSIFDYQTYTSSTGETHNVRQQCTGLTKDKDKGYWIDYGTDHNWRVDMLNNAVSNISCFTEGFGESNSLGSEKEGYMMGGYDGVQHGKVQKMKWDTEAVSNVLGGDLALPQSSAGMAEG